MSQLGEMYKLGNVVEIDYDKAFYWYRKAGEQNHPYCARMVGHFIENRMVEEEGDFGTALKWYERAGSLEEVEAQKYLGYLYFVGENVEKDLHHCIKWMTRAANQGDSHAQFLLGTIYQDHKLFDEPDYEESFKWLQMAAEQDHPEACQYTSMSYLYGFGVEPNQAEALRWMQHAASLKEPSAIHWMGVWHKHGENGLTTNAKIANKYFLEAAGMDYADAQFEYGMQLMLGEGVACNPVSAVNWLKKAARQNHKAAIYHIALAYKFGTGVEQLANEYERHLKRAAEIGYADAQYELGMNYKVGGFAKLARRWLGCAAE